MSHDEFFSIDTSAQPWDERYNSKLGKVILRKDLYTDSETGAEIRLVRYPAGLVNPAHTHPCGHGLYVLEGDLVTHKGTFGPGTFGVSRARSSAGRPLRASMVHPGTPRSSSTADEGS